MKGRIRGPVTGMIMAAALALAGPCALAQENDARPILKAMSDYMSSQQTIRLTFDSDIEVITPQLEKIQFTNSGKALLSRLNKLHAHRIGGYSDVELFFDGKTVPVYGKHVNSYAQFEGPTTVDQLLEALQAGHGVALPAADLLLTNAYDALVADDLEAKYIGRGVIDGHDCEYLSELAGGRYVHRPTYVIASSNQMNLESPVDRYS